MRRILLLTIVAFTVAWSAADVQLLCGAEAGPCDEEGIVLSNQTMLNLWYRNNGGDCVIWIDGHIMKVYPEDKIGIFSDMSCDRHYCGDITYKDLRSIDSNQDCGVRILPQCNISDM